MFDPLRLPSRTSLADSLLAKSDGLLIERLESIAIRLVQGAPPAGFPDKVGDIAQLGETEVWCLRPSEWLALARRGGSLPDPGSAICHDLSDAFISLSISGARGTELLQSGISVPLAQIAGQRFIRTLCGSVPVYLRRSGPDRFRLHFDTSLADHYWRWLRWTMQ